MRSSNALLVAVLALCAGAPLALAAEEGYYAQPTLHGDRLVFVSEGDLWTATVPPAAATGPILAHRLTRADGDESWPRLSPDGKTLAFTAQYDGNTDVYVMPAEGGPPQRLTFHPDAEVVLGWTPDGAAVLFRSGARHPLGRPELWRVPLAGGGPVRYPFGECSLASLHPDGRRLAFTRWSNEHWTWKRYRGGTAPDVWIGDLEAGTFDRLTTTEANELFPAWIGERVVFLSDRTGTANLYAQAPGGEATALTTFAPQASSPTAIEGYDVRWPSPDAALGGTRIVFTQAGALALLDTKDATLRRLDVRIASDRAEARERFFDPAETATAYRLSHDGKEVYLESRGEVLRLPVAAGLPPRQVTRSSSSREWGVTAIGTDRFALISDASGEQRIALVPADGSAAPEALGDGEPEWIFPPTAAPDGAWLAYGDKTLHLHLVEVATGARRAVDTSTAGEIRDYRFSPDGRWLAYAMPLENGYAELRLYEVATGRRVSASGPLHDDFAPRWDPAGAYLYFLSRRHLDPVMSDLDFEHAYLATVQVYAIPLRRTTPPPDPAIARAAGFDLDAWAKAPRGRGEGKGKGGEETGEGEKAEAGGDEAPGGAKGEPKAPPRPPAVEIDVEGLADRAVELPIEAGEIDALEATWGGVLWTTSPRRGLLSGRGRGRGRGGLLDGGPATLHRRDLAKEEKPESEVATGVRDFVVSGDGTTVAYANKGRLRVAPLRGERDGGRDVSTDGVPLQVDARREWGQILGEAWRLQRDFYWAPNHAGCDWAAMRAKYEALLPRVGTRAELNDLIGQMIGELGTSHTYVSGGATFDPPASVSVGLLGADLEREAGVVRIRRILPSQPWGEGLSSPLAAPHLAVAEGSVLLAVDGVPLGAARDPYELLQDRADRPVRLDLASDASGADRRTITVTPLSSERALRYAAWVETNRRWVEERSQGRLGYLHVPDMGGRGLVAFGRYFYPQVDKRGLVVDIRGNGGGFVSQMIIRRLDREVWAFMQPRHGATSRYPERSLHGHMAVLIDQHAGSDGDIFPASFRLKGLGPLIGTRTWGGVVGIRRDKPFVDLGMSSQPEFAWWSEKDGWSVENHGVAPDLEVDEAPADRVAGRRPQLDAAIDYLLAKLAEDPKDLPKPPAIPVR